MQFLFIASVLFPNALAAGMRAASSVELTARELQRARLKYKQITLEAWHGQSSEVRPLDLRLDEDDPTQVYQVGAGGFLEPYDDENYQEELEKVVDLDNDGNLNPPVSSIGIDNAKSLKIARELEADESITSSKFVSAAPIFEYTEDNDPLSLEESNFLLKKKKNPGKKGSEKKGSGKKGSGKKKSGSSSGRKEKNSSSNSGNNDNDAPMIKSMFPAKDTVIGSSEAFGALVTDDGGVQEVCVQLKNQSNELSDCYDAVHVGNDIYEITFDGFDDHEGESWSYRVRGKDESNNRETTAWVKFVINDSNGGGSSGNSGGGKSNGGRNTAKNKGSSSSTGGSQLSANINDESWPYGGVIQRSTGRILFFFNGNPFVCTGTIVDSKTEDRTIILTAAHCAYEYGKGFAEHALFIPDQDSTTGSESDEACSNDPFGCWIPAFAVIDQRWAKEGFPGSVPYDYAFYVIPNDVSVHEKGYKHYQDPNLSELLPDLTEPLPVDWNYDAYGSFITGLGYSFDKDPDFRYCSGALSGMRGLPTYENLWISNCEMTGGSSGGPWMKNTDEDGRGTVISVNSWGYTGSPGMGGPNLSTGEVKCLFERAKSRSLSTNDGYIVSDCVLH